jgi:hypothetical protein
MLDEALETVVAAWSGEPVAHQDGRSGLPLALFPYPKSRPNGRNGLWTLVLRLANIGSAARLHLLAGSVNFCADGRMGG